MRCRYNAVNFLRNVHARHPIARPLGRGIGCLLWIQHLIHIVPAIIYSISYCTGPFYNGTGLYLVDSPPWVIAVAFYMFVPATCLLIQEHHKSRTAICIVCKFKWYPVDIEFLGNLFILAWVTMMFNIALCLSLWPWLEWSYRQNAWSDFCKMILMKWLSWNNGEIMCFGKCRFKQELVCKFGMSETFFVVFEYANTYLVTYIVISCNT